MPRPTPVVPTDLQELSGRFEDWRRTRRGKLPIPEPLWEAAAELARSHGVCQTAPVLRLEDPLARFVRQEILVDPAILHDHDEVRGWVLNELNVFQWVAID